MRRKDREITDFQEIDVYKRQAQGMERGRSEERMELARKLKQKKMPMDEIMELTGLAPEDIEKL